MALRFDGLLADEVDLLKSLQENENITIGLLPVSPYVMDCFKPKSYKTTCNSHPGLGVELVLEVCSVLAINCELIVENHTQFGDNINPTGEWHGMIGQIVNHKYNTSMPCFNPTAARTKVVDFSTSVYDDTASLVTRFPDPVQFSAGALFAFDPLSVLLIISTVFILGFLSIIFDKVRFRGQRATKLSWTHGHWISSLRHSLDAAAILFQQAPSGRHRHSWAYYTIFAVWSLSCVVLIGVYSSYILAAAFTVKQTLPFWDTESLAKCIMAENCKIVAKTTSTSYFDRIYHAESDSFVPLRKAFESHEPEIIEDGIEQAQAVLDESQIYKIIILSSGQYFQMAQKYSPCSFEAVSLQTYDPVAFPFQKGSRLKSLFNRAIVTLHQQGIVQRAYNKYVGDHLNNHQCHQATVGTKAMDLTTFGGAFLAIVIGLVLGGVALLLERFVKIYEQNYSVHHGNCSPELSREKTRLRDVLEGENKKKYFLHANGNVHGRKEQATQTGFTTECSLYFRRKKYLKK